MAWETKSHWCAQSLAVSFRHKKRKEETKRKKEKRKHDLTYCIPSLLLLTIFTRIYFLYVQIPTYNYFPDIIIEIKQQTNDIMSYFRLYT